MVYRMEHWSNRTTDLEAKGDGSSSLTSSDFSRVCVCRTNDVTELLQLMQSKQQSSASLEGQDQLPIADWISAGNKSLHSK